MLYLVLYWLFIQVHKRKTKCVKRYLQETQLPRGGGGENARLREGSCRRTLEEEDRTNRCNERRDTERGSGRGVQQVGNWHSTFVMSVELVM